MQISWGRIVVKIVQLLINLLDYQCFFKDTFVLHRKTQNLKTKILFIDI